jgi:excisionase family DNA binding protein
LLYVDLTGRPDEEIVISPLLLFTGGKMEEIEKMERLFDVNSAAHLLGVSSWTVRAYIRQGRLCPVRIGRLVRLEGQEIRGFIAAARDRQVVMVVGVQGEKQ